MTTITIPENWLPTSENINALPRPVRDYIMRLHANTDPAGELRRAMVAEMERDALRKMIAEAPEVLVGKYNDSYMAWVDGEFREVNVVYALDIETPDELAGKLVKLVVIDD
ncbi:hypothetical protein ABIE51_001403 [Lysobacter sp. OAE881]|uniref:hypothetical protein n=1 Tax=Lysobacter sp. OAE881 TaxID=2663813 RepID=UPI0017896076